MFVCQDQQTNQALYVSVFAKKSCSRLLRTCQKSCILFKAFGFQKSLGSDLSLLTTIWFQ